MLPSSSPAGARVHAGFWLLVLCIVTASVNALCGILHAEHGAPLLLVVALLLVAWQAPRIDGVFARLAQLVVNSADPRLPNRYRDSERDSRLYHSREPFIGCE